MILSHPILVCDSNRAAAASDPAQARERTLGAGASEAFSRQRQQLRAGTGGRHGNSLHRLGLRLQFFAALLDWAEQLAYLQRARSPSQNYGKSRDGSLG